MNTTPSRSNWTDPEWDEDMIDIIWYDGKDK